MNKCIFISLLLLGLAVGPATVALVTTDSTPTAPLSVTSQASDSTNVLQPTLATGAIQGSTLNVQGQ